ncbi:Transcriptional regulator, contains XRE-family HTH domain [Alicyclobacillus hesperidum]|uniref:Transcriptional regulator, contains XRE-family HTH domain n=1 Tax=Alicyclobacillus hesperidum TaxID=89784 RepID=A0A1H2YEU6_9BACL|nr:helix-turn-helix transcriptional regulator [Alicyclobacillus hesperidum]SDX03732.1 Transcriptional regulator, contains XRE-family HTH domain [Alicyclobacillus hesperidum]
MNLGERMAFIRKKKGLTQQDVADKLGISRGTYAHYEINKREPDLDMLKRIASVLGVTISHLIGDDPPSVSSEESEFLEWVRSNLEDVFFYEFHGSPEEMKQELMDTLRALWKIKKKRRNV